MRCAFILAVLLNFFCGGVFGEVLSLVDSPHDDINALGGCSNICNRPEFKPLDDEYNELIELRFWPLKQADITAIFGAKLAQRPPDCARPVFAPMFVCESGLGWNDAANKRHIDFHAIGNIGFLEAHYQYAGVTIATCVIYFRTDKNFVPLKSTNDISKRLKWDTARFKTLKKWLDVHLPKLKDLGVVEVSESHPTRIDLGKGTACIITTRDIHCPAVPLWFTLDLAKETTDAKEKGKSMQHRSVDRAGESVSFAMDGKFYRLTPKLVDKLHAVGSVER